MVISTVADLVGGGGSCHDLGLLCSCPFYDLSALCSCLWGACVDVPLLLVGVRCWCQNKLVCDLNLWTSISLMVVFCGFHCTASSLRVLCLHGRTYFPVWLARTGNCLDLFLFLTCCVRPQIPLRQFLMRNGFAVLCDLVVFVWGSLLRWCFFPRDGAWLDFIFPRWI